MKRPSGRQALLSLAPVSMVAVVLALMALQDIYHGETDLSLEWMIVRISFLVIIIFNVLALAALGRFPAESRTETAPR